MSIGGDQQGIAPRKMRVFRARTLITATVALIGLVGSIATIFTFVTNETLPQLLATRFPSATATTMPSATAITMPTATTAPPTITPVVSTTAADRAAAASFSNITVETGRDPTCSSSLQVTTFSSGQAIYVDLCASQTVAHAPLKITVRQGGVVVWTLASGTVYVSPGTDSFYYTMARFNPGSYTVVVTMQINGQTGTARRIPITIT